MEDRSQEGRKHIFAINGSVDFLSIVRELFQEEDYNVTTTNFVPTSFAQIEALQPDAHIVDIAVGQSAGWELLEQLNESAATTGIPVCVLRSVPCDGHRRESVSRLQEGSFMPVADDIPDGSVYDAADQLKHDLKTPLTTIYSRAYLLGRAVRRAPSLTDEERGKMLEGVAAIETVVRTMSALIDTMGDEGVDGERSLSLRRPSHELAEPGTRSTT